MIRVIILLVLLISCELYEDVSAYNLVDYKMVQGRLYFKGRPFTGKLKKIESDTIKLIEYENGLEDGRYLEIYRNGSTVKDITYKKGEPFKKDSRFF